MNLEEVKTRLSYFGSELTDILLQAGEIKEIGPDTELIREGQFVKYLPIVIDGIIKVFTRQEDKELLLYYIQPFESCVMSFSSCLNNEASKIFAITEVESTVLLLPSSNLPLWINKYPRFNVLFYQQYDLRYTALIETIHHLLYDKLDKRLLEYMKDKLRVNKMKLVKLSHREMASDLGTAREVVSRILKKLEKEGKIAIHQEGIEILYDV